MAPREAGRPAARRASSEDDDRFLACASCRRPITTHAARISVSGQHEHSFTNPDGLRFHIGCFASVSGCRAVGSQSSYWTWFPGHRWQVELCGACRVQLGWLFRSDERRFHALILDRLIELQAGPMRES